MKRTSDKPAVPSTDGATRRIVGGLQRRYVLALVAVAVLVVLNQLVVQPSLMRLDADSSVINVAGRQRMLSQRVTKAALAIFHSNDAEEIDSRRAELWKAVQEWSVAQTGLQSGDEKLSVPGTDSPQVRAAFTDIEPHFEAMRLAANDINRLYESGVLPAERSLEAQDTVDRILKHEAQYLPRMDAIVSLFEQESRNHVAVLRNTGWMIAASVVLLMLAVSRFVLRPAVTLIEEQLRALALEREIQERHRAERRIRELTDQLAHATRLSSIGQLAAGLAHEINQPLGAVSNYAEGCLLLVEQGRTDSPEFRHALDGIRQSAWRAGKIISRVRSFVQRRESVRSSIDVNRLVDEVVELCLPEARQRSIRLQVRQDAGLPHACGDAIQIQQVLVNLIQNAFQAMAETALEQRQVAISTRCGDDAVEVEVHDSGAGFDSDRIDELFQPFITSSPDGLGMGLAISHAIVREHGGRMWGRSQRGQGAVMSFSIPAGGCA